MSQEPLLSRLNPYPIRVKNLLSNSEVNSGLSNFVVKTGVYFRNNIFVNLTICILAIGYERIALLAKPAVNPR
ncbi:hypothetical protein Xenpb_03380 [Xenorhabdus sp. PB62.4]|nr:hypothetical protein [Xenorhabdus sp. PB62.4]